jgi:tryptophan synthase beta subunit
MKLSFLIGAAAGYVLGARAGRERYEAIVRVGRRVAGSQTVQSAAGVFQAQVDELSHKVRDVVAAKVGNGSSSGPNPNGSRSY